MGSKTPRPGPLEGDAARRRRLAENERVFRRLNGRIEELNRVAQMVEAPPHAEQAAFLCECSLSECHERIRIGVDEYARTHATPDRFIVIPGHETGEIEQVVTRRTDYLVVVKR
jgi:hypothetical protein